MKFSFTDLAKDFRIIYISKVLIYSFLRIPVHVKKNVGIHKSLNNVRIINNYKNFDANPHPVSNRTR